MEGIVVADVLHHLAQGLHVVGILAVFHQLTKEVAQNAAEILVAGVAQEGAGVGEHTVEGAHGTQAHEADHLCLHAGLVVVEPPGGTLLNLAGDGSIGLECTNQRANHAVVGGVQGVENGLGQGILGFQLAQQLGKAGGIGLVVDGVVAGVCANLGEHLDGVK